MSELKGLENKFVVIEGNIGVGKTMLSKKLAQYFNGTLVLEAFEDNPFLPKFYKNKERYGFSLEMSFLAARYKQFKNELEHASLFHRITIADYYLMKSFIFAKNTLSSDEFQLYRQFFELISAFSIKPDVMLYLHREVDVLKKNIIRRGREYELEIEEEYLLSIQKGYFDYFKGVTDFPIVIIDASKADFHEERAFNQVVDMFNIKFKKGVTYTKID